MSGRSARTGHSGFVRRKSVKNDVKDCVEVQEVVGTRRHWMRSSCRADVCPSDLGFNVSDPAEASTSSTDGISLTLVKQ